MFKDVDALREQLRVYGLERLEDKIVQLAKPAIKLIPYRVDDNAVLIGASKLGGNPDLPPDFQWKYHGDKPLTFIGQFKLSEIASYDKNKELPETGMLYFFYEADEVPIKASASQLLYIEDDPLQLVR